MLWGPFLPMLDPQAREPDAGLKTVPVLRAQGASNWETARATAADQPSAGVVAKKEGRRGFYHHQAVTFTACGKASNPEMPTITVKKLSNKNSLL